MVLALSVTLGDPASTKSTKAQNPMLRVSALAERMQYQPNGNNP
jgi:hypothetical protein